jgi:hypothetical protein
MKKSPFLKKEAHLGKGKEKEKCNRNTSYTAHPLRKTFFAKTLCGIWLASTFYKVFLFILLP